MTLARICTLPGLDWGRGRLRERWGTRLPHHPRHAESGSDSQSPSAAPEHTTQHEVEPCTDSRGPAPATPVYQRGLASPGPEACPAASSFGPEAKRKDWRAGGGGTWRFYTFWGLRLPPLPLPPQIFSSSSPASSALPCGAGRRAGEGGRCTLRTPQGWLPLPRDSSKRRSRAASPPPSGAPRPPLAPRSPARPSQRKAAGAPRLYAGWRQSITLRACQGADAAGPRRGGGRPPRAGRSWRTRTLPQVEQRARCWHYSPVYKNKPLSILP